MAAIRSKDEPRRAWPTKLKGENERAIADFSKALDLDPRLAKAHYNRAAVYRTKSEIDPAIADYSKTIEIDPQYSNAYFSRDSVEAIGDDKNPGEFVEFGSPFDDSGRPRHRNRGD
jgi:tetratricopeptide (TPR) repeat protein